MKDLHCSSVPVMMVHAQEVWQEDSVRRQYSKSLICKSRDNSETMLWTSTSTWVGDRALG